MLEYWGCISQYLLGGDYYLTHLVKTPHTTPGGIYNIQGIQGDNTWE